MSPNKNTVLDGDQVTYTLTVTNNGPSDDSGVAVTDLLPDGLVFVSSNGEGNDDAKTGLWTIGPIATGGSASININTQVSDPDGN